MRLGLGLFIGKGKGSRGGGKTGEYFYINNYGNNINTVTITRAGSTDVSHVETSYDCETWTDIGGTAETGSLTFDIPANSKVYMRCVATTWNDVRITANKSHYIGGNLTSLIYGDADHTELNGEEFCFYQLFKGNTTLAKASALEMPTGGLAKACLMGLFSGCTSLIDCPQPRANTLAMLCYAFMFDNCTQLRAVPTLNTTSLAVYCYSGMFYNCEKLAVVPELPATTLEMGCYNAMFYGCSSITTAPELPATTLKDACYAGMFEGCSKLGYIKAMFTTTPSDTYTQRWVEGVAATGTFIKSHDATWDVVGNNGIPTGWEIIKENDYFYIEDKSGVANKITITRGNVYDVENVEITYDFNTWTNVGGTTTTGTIEIPLPANGKVYMRCVADTWAFVRISAIGNHNVGGNIMSLIWGSQMLPKMNGITSQGYGRLYAIFQYDTTLIRADDLHLPAVTLDSTEGAYGHMFEGCSSLTAAPKLPATVLGVHCYTCMFKDCVALTTAPELPIMNLQQFCYSYMFSGCVSLVTAPVLPALELNYSCYSHMFTNCSNLNYVKALFKTPNPQQQVNSWLNGVAETGTFVKNPEFSDAQYCVPSGWTIVDADM